MRTQTADFFESSSNYDSFTRNSQWNDCNTDADLYNLSPSRTVENKGIEQSLEPPCSICSPADRQNTKKKSESALSNETSHKLGRRPLRSLQNVTPRKLYRNDKLQCEILESPASHSHLFEQAQPSESTFPKMRSPWTGRSAPSVFHPRRAAPPPICIEMAPSIPTVSRSMPTTPTVLPHTPLSQRSTDLWPVDGCESQPGPRKTPPSPPQRTTSLPHWRPGTLLESDPPSEWLSESASSSPDKPVERTPCALATATASAAAETTPPGWLAELALQLQEATKVRAPRPSPTPVVQSLSWP